MDKASHDEVPAAILAGHGSRDKVDAYLDEQAKLARLQSDELRDDLKLHHWRRRVEHWSGLLKLSFEIGLAILVLLVMVGAVAAIWNATHDRALVIEAFSVPPDVAARGLDGRAVAAHLQDKLAAMQTATQSVRPADSYSNDWGNDIKVQIPETGISIGELHRVLVAWLGHQTHITGEVWHAADGLAITTRTSADAGVTVTGADFDKLLQQTAETVYRRTQPYRYAVYLLYRPNPPWERVRAIYEDLAVTGSRRERAWAYVGLSNIYSSTGQDARSLEELRHAIALLPGFALPYQNIEGQESSASREERALNYAVMALRVLPGDREITPDVRAVQISLVRGEENLLRNNFAQALRDYDAAAALAASSQQAEAARERGLFARGFLHDAAGVRAAFRALPPSAIGAVRANRDASLMFAQYALGEWATLTADFGRLKDDITQSVKSSGANDIVVEQILNRQVRPYFAVALAMQGELAKAHAMLDMTPLDCDACLRSRGRIAAAEHRWAAAQYWFERAVHHAPSIPLGYSEWGAMLLAKGDLRGAIAKFALAHYKEPHFADPLEMWGEALITNNRSDLALAKFEEAGKEAPNWGRLHLKWGEALGYLGHAREAAAQFAIADSLLLTQRERAELSRVWHG